ncbi:hypothetical protein GCM10025879_12760 [Leuconostoc litchii]|uniref:Regulatory protein YycH domain-containing protein n=1 Tax=Leuconostoc litchii TaxID=1981069 RepID=A0A6P2CK88_9LACO|nr:two-component system activity regulator YycH [Leuconostoc litchii]TYC46311.1 hypothetical protein ESZ47_07495 [Leuconostoc litchii]GMA70030.1 hypothetical protein GCM10025879_12760 [Leuconostoc litchii]
MQNNRLLQSVLINVVLTVSIIISIVLTALIFLSAGNQEAPTQTEQQSQQVSELFRPTNYIVNDKNGAQHLVMHATNAQYKSIHQYLANARLTNPLQQKVTNAQIKKVLNIKQAAVYHYPDVIPIAYFNSYYSQRVSTRKSFNFDYVVVPLADNKRAYFVNTQSKKITTVDISNINASKAWQVAGKLPKALTVNFKVVNDHVMLNYPTSFKLPVYSYLVNRRDPTTYVSTLLGTTNQLKKTTEGNKTIYTNKYSNQQIIYDSDLETVTFTDNRTTGTLKRSYYNRLNIGFSQINLLQLDLSDTRFYQSRNNGQDVTYRTFVEGLPVYYQSKSGAIHMALDKYGNLTSTYSLNELGVPVPNNQPKVTLPKAADVLSRLKHAGVKSSEYYSIAPGYEWLSNKENNVSVNMQPTWMVETSKGWASVDTFLSGR